MALYNNVIKRVQEEEENPGAHAEKVKSLLIGGLETVGNFYDAGDKAAGIYEPAEAVSDKLAEIPVVGGATSFAWDVFRPDFVDVAAMKTGPLAGGSQYVSSLPAGIARATAKRTDPRQLELTIDSILNAPKRLKDWGKRTVENITSPIRTAKGLIGEESIVANVGTGLDEAFTKLQGVNTLNPDGPIFLAGKGKRAKVASGLVTGGKHVSENVFNKQGDKIRKIVEEFFPELKTPKFFRRNLRYHHTGPIKQFAQAVNGLTDEAAEWGGDYMAKRLGQNLGMSKQQMSVLPDEFHKRIHALFNKLVGEKYTLAEIERKLNLPKDWQSTYTLEQRIPIFNELVDATIDSKEAIDTFWRSLANRKDLGKVNRREFINSSIEIAELDKRLSAIGGKTSTKTATEIISELLGRSNTALENAVNLVENTAQQDALYKVYLNNQGEQALWEVLIDGASPAKVFKKYEIKVSDTKEVEKVIGEITLSDEAYKIMKRRRGQSEIKVINPSESGQDHL